MNTAKEGIRALAETCYTKGIRKVVFSPGSRSAPLVIAFSNIPGIECFVIPDERVAGYFALGLAQQMQEVVAVVCTSGTAILNLLPACCEAKYQDIPLLFLTADRPYGSQFLGENQTIEQRDAFFNYAREYEVDTDADSIKKIVGTVENALFNAAYGKEPARINIYLSEPLYDMADTQKELPKNVFSFEPEENTVPQRIESCKRLSHDLEKSKTKLVLVGMHTPDEAFKQAIQKLAQREDFIVLVEPISNCSVEGSIFNYDSCMQLLSDVDFRESYLPDMVITLGNGFTSKRIRQVFRRFQPTHHWDIPAKGESEMKNYFNMPQPDYARCIREEEALECLLEAPSETGLNYRSQWQALAAKVEELKNSYLKNTGFTDFTVAQRLVASFPENANIQYGNSTPVRYSGFFRHNPSLTVNANRGASGIDGCVSTAAGAAFVNKRLTINIVGDVTFFYDSNALWNNYLSPDFRVIVINNGGGNIFRLIDGPTKVTGFEKFFETKHELSAQHLAAMYGIPYYFSDRFETLDETLKTFYGPQNGRPAILEIKTNNEASATVYKQYFEYLSTNR